MPHATALPNSSLHTPLCEIYFARFAVGRIYSSPPRNAILLNPQGCIFFAQIIVLTHIDLRRKKHKCVALQDCKSGRRPEEQRDVCCQQQLTSSSPLIKKNRHRRFQTFNRFLKWILSCNGILQQGMPISFFLIITHAKTHCNTHMQHRISHLYYSVRYDNGVILLFALYSRRHKTQFLPK